MSTYAPKSGAFPLSAADIFKLWISNAPVTVSLEANGSSEAGWAASGSVIGGVFIFRGTDRLKIKSFSSLGVGGGLFGVSGQVVGMKYYYLGSIDNFNMQLFSGESIDAELSIGEGVIGGGVLRVVQNPNYRDEFLIGIGGYVGLGAGSPVSWSITWQNTYVN